MTSNNLAVKKYQRGLRQQVIDAYGGTCAICGEDMFEFLTMDHISDKISHRKGKLRGMALLRWLRDNDFPSEFQILCWNCNDQKNVENLWSVNPSTTTLYQREERITVLKAYGMKCACCGEENQKFLTIDHVNGGGKKEAERIGPANIPRWIIQQGFPSSYRLLCFKCNSSLGLYGYCPHRLGV